MSRRPLTLMALLAVIGVCAFGMPTLSGATFTAVSRNTASVTAAADWTPPTVSVTSPGTSVKDTLTITAAASDAQSGIRTVELQYLAPGASAWASLCTASTSPYTCSWNTKLVADGRYDLRAIATDNAGYQTTSDSVSTTVANNLLVVLSDPGAIVKGTQSLTTTIYNANAVTYTVKVEYSVSGAGSWKSLCSNLGSPYSCSWNTAGSTFTQGESYDLRATATAGSTSTTSAVVVDVLVDNTAPTAVTMTDPGTPLRGTVTLAATASDAESGIAGVVLQAQKGTGAWATLCTLSIDPFTCRYDTTQLTDGTYGFRAVATDAAGNTTNSAVVASRVVDNTVSSVSVEDPGAFLSGTVALTATASSTAGVSSVRIDRAPNGSATWTSVCTDSTSPYTCPLDTTVLADGLYDFRAVVVDGAGRTTTSATVAARRVDNTPLKAYDVQTVNGGAKAGRLDTGDKLVLTYSDQVNPASVMTGWTGAATGVTLRLRDGNAVSSGLGGTNDTVDVLNGSTVLGLGSVNLKSNLIKNGKTTTFIATMTATTTTVNGTTATVVTITAGTTSGAGNLRTATSATLAVWTPSTAALDLFGKPCSAAPATERGAANLEF